MTVMQVARPLPAWADAERCSDLPSLCAKGEGQEIKFKLDISPQSHDVAKSIAAIAELEPLERMPGMGSPRLGQVCEIPGLRSWRVTDFPMQWLYFEAEDHPDVVRLLGDRQDMIAILTAGE